MQHSFGSNKHRVFQRVREGVGPVQVPRSKHQEAGTGPTHVGYTVSLPSDRILLLPRRTAPVAASSPACSSGRQTSRPSAPPNPWRTRTRGGATRVREHRQVSCRASPCPPSHTGALRRPRLGIGWHKAIRVDAPLHPGLDTAPNCGLGHGWQRPRAGPGRTLWAGPSPPPTFAPAARSWEAYIPQPP
jgi:hypothetical protein